MSDTACLYEGERCWPLEGALWVLGRQAPADLVFAYPEVSRRHASLEYREGGYFLKDLGSRFGTFCRGKQVGEEPVRLQDGDELVLGGILALRFCDPAETRGGRRLGRLTGVWLDEDSHQSWVDGQLLQPSLSAAQFTLLRVLLAREGHFLSRDEVCLALWPEEAQEGVSEEALDGLVKRVRARLKEAGGEHYLEVKRGRGLRLLAPG